MKSRNSGSKSFFAWRFISPGAVLTPFVFGSSFLALPRGVLCRHGQHQRGGGLRLRGLLQVPGAAAADADLAASALVDGLHGLEDAIDPMGNGQRREGGREPNFGLLKVL